MKTFNADIDRARKSGDQAGWAELVGNRFKSPDAAHRIDALVEAHFAAETAAKPAFREFAAIQAMEMDRRMQRDPIGRLSLAALKTPDATTGETNLQKALNSKALASGAAVSAEHGILALQLRGVIRTTPVSPA
jgi:hypothetical protein